MSPLDAAVEEARAAWSRCPKDAPAFVRNELRRQFDDASARRNAHWSTSVVIGGIEAELFARTEPPAAYVAPDVQRITDAALTSARETAIATRDALDSAARAESSRLYAARRDLDAAIKAYSAAYVAEREAAAAYSNAADTCCAIGEEAARRIRALTGQIGALSAA